MTKTKRSLRCENAQLPVFAPLETDLRRDVLIIGGGMADNLRAHMLREAGVDCTLVEACSTCSGVSGNTTARLTVQHGLICHKRIQALGWEHSWDLPCHGSCFAEDGELIDNPAMGKLKRK